MRQKLNKLFKNIVVLQYNLPNDGVPRSVVSTSDDFVFKAKNDSDVADIIYNSIVDLAFDDYEIDTKNLNELQKISLEYRIRYNIGDESDKLKLGFYGEALLNVFLQLFFGTDVFVARGEFFDLLSNSEIHGYDCHHIIEKDNCIEFWFGESKFYESYHKALRSVWDNLNNDISLKFLNKNLQTIFQKKYKTYAKGQLIEKFIEECQKDPFRNYYDDIKKYGGKLVYPILVVTNELKNSFEKTIQSYIDKITNLNKKNPIKMPNDLHVELFFIFMPVKDAKQIKMEVLECIQKNKPLI